MVIIMDTERGIREPIMESQSYEDEILFAEWIPLPSASLVKHEALPSPSGNAADARCAAAILADPDFIARIYRTQQ